MTSGPRTSLSVAVLESDAEVLTIGHMTSGQKVGPVVVAESALRALMSIRHEWLLDQMFGGAVICESVDRAVQEIWTDTQRPAFIRVLPDQTTPLPPRLVSVQGSDRVSIELAIATDSRLLLIEGKALLERVKLSFIKSMGTIPLLVQAYQEGRIKSVKPLLVALERKGHEMPPAEQMRALTNALNELAGS